MRGVPLEEYQQDQHGGNDAGAGGARMTAIVGVDRIMPLPRHVLALAGVKLYPSRPSSPAKSPRTGHVDYYDAFGEALRNIQADPPHRRDYSSSQCWRPRLYPLRCFVPGMASPPPCPARRPYISSRWGLRCRTWIWRPCAIEVRVLIRLVVWPKNVGTGPWVAGKQPHSQLPQHPD